MTASIIRNSTFLESLYYAEPRERQQLLHDVTNDQIEGISVLARYILNGGIMITNVQRRKLKHFKETLRCLKSHRISASRKKRLLRTHHNLLPLLIQPFLSLLNEL